jgi:hypothetical protein
LASPVYVGPVIDAYDVDGPFGLIDSVDHSVSAAPYRMITGELAGEWLANPVRIV